jgi:hypothetical protein
MNYFRGSLDGFKFGLILAGGSIDFHKLPTSRCRQFSTMFFYNGWSGLLPVADFTYEETKSRRLDFIDYQRKQAIPLPRIPLPPLMAGRAKWTALAGKGHDYLVLIAISSDMNGTVPEDSMAQGRHRLRIAHCWSLGAPTVMPVPRSTRESTQGGHNRPSLNTHEGRVLARFNGVARCCWTS